MRSPGSQAPRPDASGPEDFGANVHDPDVELFEALEALPSGHHSRQIRLQHPIDL
jgi:hypothetical protein